MEKKEKKVWIIRYSGSGFYMTAPDGELFEGKKPREYARYALERGADEVRHDYDLTLAET